MCELATKQSEKCDGAGNARLALGPMPSRANVVFSASAGEVQEAHASVRKCGFRQARMAQGVK